MKDDDLFCLFILFLLLVLCISFIDPENGTYYSENETIVWDYLKGAGFSDVQTAGLIGNLYQESYLEPSIAERGTR